MISVHDRIHWSTSLKTVGMFMLQIGPVASHTKRTMATWVSIAVLGSLLSLSLGQTIGKDATCTNSSSSSLNLTCETGEMLHVISVQYQNMTPSCESPPAASCVFLQETHTDSLYTDCNGVTTCVMEVSKSPIETACGDTTTFQATITYECVSDRQISVCNNATYEGQDNRLYLTSPNFPRGSGNEIGRCMCDVTGSNMNVTIFEYYFASLEGVRANLTLMGERSNLTMTDVASWASSGILVYNTVVMEYLNTLEVIFDPIQSKGTKREDVWMKVEGALVHGVTCTGGILKTDYTTDLTADTTKVNEMSITADPTTTNKNIEVDDESNTSVLGCVFAAIAAVIVAIFIIILMRRRRSRPEKQSGDDSGVRIQEVEPCELHHHVMDVLHDMSSRQVHQPLSSHYADVEANGTTKVDTLNFKDRKSHSASSVAQERPEDMYTKVIPKQYRPGKQNGNLKNTHKSVRDSDNANDNGVTKAMKKLKLLGKTERPLTVPGDQEIENISNSEASEDDPQLTTDSNPKLDPVIVFFSSKPDSDLCDTDRPVSEKLHTTYQDIDNTSTNDEEMGQKRQFQSEERSLRSHMIKTRHTREDKFPKSQKEKSMYQCANMKNPPLLNENDAAPVKALTVLPIASTDDEEDIMIDNVLYEAADDILNEESAPPMNALCFPSTDSGSEDDVIVDNDLYEGGPAEGHYDDYISSDGHSAQHHHQLYEEN